MFNVGKFNNTVNYLLGKEGYVFGNVGLSFCGHYSKSYKHIRIKFYEEVLGCTIKN